MDECLAGKSEDMTSHGRRRLVQTRRRLYNMGDPRNLAGAFYNNARAYAGVVLQIGSAYGNQNCR